MAESIQTIVKRGSISIPPSNKILSIKRMQANGTYEADWVDISKYVQSWGSISIGFPDDVYVGEFEESSASITLNNNGRVFNDEADPDSMFFGYKTRFKTKFKIELYVVDKDENDVLARAWYGINLSNPTTNDSGDMTFDISPLTKILQYYKAEGVSLSTGTTEDLVTRMMVKEQDGVSIFTQYFEGTDINPDSVVCMSIANPYIEEKDTILGKIRDYSAYQNFFYYVDNRGYFVWDTREATATTEWKFNGAGSYDAEYGSNINSISAEYNDIDNTYNRIVITHAINQVLETTFFTGIRASNDSASLTDANSLTIWTQLQTDLYIDSEYRLTQLYITDRSTLDAYLLADFPLYQDAIIERLSKTVNSEKLDAIAGQVWTIGDGSSSDIYGEQMFQKTYAELNVSEADAVANRLLTAYLNTKKVWEANVYGVFQLNPKARVELNYIGELTADNPFVLGVSLLGGTDVLTGYTGAMRLDGDLAKIEMITINLDNYDITMKWREL